MKNYIFIATLIFFLSMNAQQGDHGLSQSWESINDLNSMVSKADNFNNNIKNNTNYFTDKNNRVEIQNIIGSIYLDENFRKGKIHDVQKGIVIDALTRYRIIDDTFEVKSKLTDTETILMDRSDKFDVIINNQKFTFLNNLPIELKGVNNGYAIVLTENNNTILYKRLIQDYIPPQKATTAMESDKKARLKDDSYYFIKINNNLLEITPHKKEAYKAFPDHQKELEAYIKKEKLKFKDEEEDLKTLVEYYTSIQ